MSGPAEPLVIEDAFEFTRSAGLRSGQLAVASLPRLQDQLCGNDGVLDYTLTGGRDRQNRPQLRLQIGGELQLSCARCLGPVHHGLSLDSTLLLVQPGTQPTDDDDPEAPDWIEAGRDLDVLQLLEDEILLGLPISVSHPEGACEGGERLAVASGRLPFKSLAGWRSGGDGNKD